MARNTPLAVVRSMVKAESQKSLQTGSNAQDTEINQIIWDNQAKLASMFDWPFLKCRWDNFLNPGTRYQAFPTTNTVGLTCQVDMERPPTCETKWNNIWIPVVYGIDEIPEFNYLDSDRGQVLDPVQRWQFDDETQFEVWPLPATSAQVRFIGQRTLTSLFSVTNNSISWNDSATLDLDDQLISAFAAADYLASKKSPRAEVLQVKAARHLQALRGAYPVRQETCSIGRGQQFGRKTIRLVPLVLVGGK
jgi:hypothetical protein